MRSVGRNGRGMTLLEVLVVVAIAASIIGGVVVILQGQDSGRRREAAIQQQTDDMVLLVKAARQFGAVTAAGWADGTRAEVALVDLVDAGLLPDNFGTEDGSGDLGVTPIGQRYSVYAIKDGDTYDDPTVEDGTVRSVILDLGTPHAGRLARAGVPDGGEALQVIKEAVALQMVREERIAAGVLVAGTHVVRGVGRSFEKDILDWIEDGPTHGATVALVGFHDLDGLDDEDEPVEPPDEETQYETCTVLSDVEGCSGSGCAAWSPPVCPAGWDELATPRICGTAGQTVVSTAPGVMVSGASTIRTTSGNLGWGFCGTWEETLAMVVVTLNGGQIFETLCGRTRIEESYGSGGECIRNATEFALPTVGRGVYGKLCCLPRATP